MTIAELRDKVWVWVTDRDWEVLSLDTTLKCRKTTGKPLGGCSKPAVAELKRRNGWWAYCAGHLYGRKVEDGVVKVEVHPDSIAAKRGYVSRKEV